MEQCTQPNMGFPRQCFYLLAAFADVKAIPSFNDFNVNEVDWLYPHLLHDSKGRHICG